MKNILKSLLALSLVLPLGLSAAEDKTGKPIQQESNAKIAASIAANILAIGAMTVANAYICGQAIELYSNKSIMTQYLPNLIILASKLGMVELSNHLINKLGLKTNKLGLYAFTFSGIPSMIKHDIKNYIDA